MPTPPKNPVVSCPWPGCGRKIGKNSLPGHLSAHERKAAKSTPRSAPAAGPATGDAQDAWPAPPDIPAAGEKEAAKEGGADGAKTGEKAAGEVPPVSGLWSTAAAGVNMALYHKGPKINMSPEFEASMDRNTAAVLGGKAVPPEAGLALGIGLGFGLPVALNIVVYLREHWGEISAKIRGPAAPPMSGGAPQRYAPTPFMPWRNRGQEPPQTAEYTVDPRPPAPPAPAPPPYPPQAPPAPPPAPYAPPPSAADQFKQSMTDHEREELRREREELRRLLDEARAARGGGGPAPPPSG